MNYSPQGGWIMEYQRFENTIVARLDRGEEIIDSLRRLAEAEDISLAHVSALGAADEFTVGIYDVAEQKYHSFSFAGPYEITSLTGTIDTMNGEFYTHLHMNAATLGGQVAGGHLNRARISATCEMVITLIPGRTDRRKDETVGLNLFRFENGKTL